MTHPSAHPDFWHQRWQSNQIGFHEGKPNPHLQRFMPALAPPGSRVLVPLCGKTVDMGWLAEQGYEVVGVELSEIACAAFFAERGLEPLREQVGPYVRWSCGPVTLLQGDIFDLDDRFDAIWDRAALVALPPALRERYAAKMRACLRPGAAMLILTFVYDQTRRDGPPFSVDDAALQALYPEAQRLFSQEIDEPRWRDLGGFAEVVWRVG